MEFLVYFDNIIIHVDLHLTSFLWLLNNRQIKDLFFLELRKKLYVICVTEEVELLVTMWWRENS